MTFDFAIDAAGVRGGAPRAVADDLDALRSEPTLAITRLSRRRRWRSTCGGNGRQASTSRPRPSAISTARVPFRRPVMVGPTLCLDPQTIVTVDGRVVSSMNNIDPVTGLKPLPQASQPGAALEPSTGRWLLASLLFETLLGLMLIVCGVEANAGDGPRVLSLHLRYVYLKLVATAMGIWLTGRLIAELSPGAAAKRRRRGRPRRRVRGPG